MDARSRALSQAFRKILHRTIQEDTMDKQLLPDLLRRRLVGSLLYAAAAASFATPGRAAVRAVPIEVWTGPGCSCCHDWIEHLETNGFTVSSHDGGNSEARARLGMPMRYGSCHSAEAAGYAIEGHVPAREIQRLLEEMPDAVGLSVPAMPRGSPGMDGPVYGGVRDPYDVLLIARDGTARVYQPYR
jgi:hypothetical protein